MKIAIIRPFTRIYLGVQKWTASGFPLNNVEGRNVYPSVNINECQELCEITKNCLYFVHGTKTNNCYVKYGLANEGLAFGASNDALTGHRFSPSKFINF